MNVWSSAWSVESLLTIDDSAVTFLLFGIPSSPAECAGSDKRTGSTCFEMCLTTLASSTRLKFLQTSALVEKEYESSERSMRGGSPTVAMGLENLTDIPAPAPRTMGAVDPAREEEATLAAEAGEEAPPMWREDRGEGA